MVVHLKRCNYVEEEIHKEYQNTKCKLTQQTFHIMNSSSEPMTETEYDEFQKQNLYACLDASLVFHYTKSLHVQKLFKMMKSTVKMPNRKAVSGKILDSKNDQVFTEMIAVMKTHSDSFGGATLAVDAIIKQSLFGQMMMCARLFTVRLGGCDIKNTRCQVYGGENI